MWQYWKVHSILDILENMDNCSEIKPLMEVVQFSMLLKYKGVWLRRKHSKTRPYI